MSAYHDNYQLPAGVRLLEVPVVSDQRAGDAPPGFYLQSPWGQEGPWESPGAAAAAAAQVVDELQFRRRCEAAVGPAVL